MAAKVIFFPVANSAPAAAYGMRMVLFMVTARGLPLLAWLLSPTPAFHRRIRTSTLLLARTLNTLYILHYVLFLQAFCLRTGCQLVRGMFLDILLLTIFVEPLIKQTRFVLHMPMSLLELGASIFTLASSYGVCGALHRLNSPSNADTCDAQCMQTVQSGMVSCSTQFSTAPCAGHAQLPPLLRTAVDWVLSAMHLPEDAGFVDTCPELLVLGQQRCAVLGKSMRAGARAVAHVISWLTVSPGIPEASESPSSSTSAAPTGAAVLLGGVPGGKTQEETLPSVCAELVLVTLVSYVCMACVLYHSEAARRWQWWQSQHTQQVLHPPLKTLRVFLAIQHLFLVMAVVCMAWVGMLGLL